jgi:hypothetical protein
VLVMLEHVLELKTLVHDPAAVPEAELAVVSAAVERVLADVATVAEAEWALVDEVVEWLDVVDLETEPFLLHEWVPATAAAMRAVLGLHRPDQAWRCRACSAVGWPCPSWRAVCRWIFEFDADGYRRNVEGYWVVTRPKPQHPTPAEPHDRPA